MDMGHRPRLLASAALGAACGVLAFRGFEAGPSRAVLLGWCTAVVAWMVLLMSALGHASPAVIRARAAKFDEGRWAILGATLTASFAALMAVMWEIGAAPSPIPPTTLALGMLSITLSWAFVHVLFAAHYAHAHWVGAKGISFPGCDAPDFWEFLYFAFTVGMTFQVSDATTETSAMRRLVLAHASVSFVFNAVILAAAVNLAAGLAR